MLGMLQIYCCCLKVTADGAAVQLACESARKGDGGRPYWNKKIRQLSRKILTPTIDQSPDVFIKIYTTCFKKNTDRKKYNMLKIECYLLIHKIYIKLS